MGQEATTQAGVLLLHDPATGGSAVKTPLASLAGVWEDGPLAVREGAGAAGQEWFFRQRGTKTKMVPVQGGRELPASLPPSACRKEAGLICCAGL